MVVRVVAVGKLKAASLREACEDYGRRIRRYTKLEVQEVREAGRRAADDAAARRIEGEALLAGLPARGVVVALTRTGSALDTLAFAERLRGWRDAARDVSFVIGGAWGLDVRVLEAADLRLSVSPMTLPHELARLVLLEQLYRACTILRGEPYHKGRR